MYNENDYQRYLLGKNLLNITGKTSVINEVTFTNNGDGSITVNGTAKYTTFFLAGYITELTGEYIISGCPSNGNNNMHASARNDSSGNGVIANDYGGIIPPGGQPNTFTRNNQGVYYFIRIQEGTQVDNVVFWPMIRSSSIEDSTYSSYSMRVQDLTKLTSRLDNEIFMRKNILTLTPDPQTFLIKEDFSFILYKEAASGTRIKIDSTAANNFIYFIFVCRYGIYYIFSGLGKWQVLSDWASIGAICDYDGSSLSGKFNLYIEDDRYLILDYSFIYDTPLIYGYTRYSTYISLQMYTPS